MRQGNNSGFFVQETKSHDSGYGDILSSIF